MPEGFVVRCTHEREGNLKTTLSWPVFAYAATLCAPACAQQFSVAAFRDSARTTEIRPEKVADGLYVLFGVGGNIAASIGPQGVLIVDTQFTEIVPKYKAAIRELGGGRIDFAIDTHWHVDHADGNHVLGPDGTWLVAQENSRRMLTERNVLQFGDSRLEQAAYPAAALPILAFDDRMQMHFNGERVDLAHFGRAHTGGDAAVFFRGRNVVHLGDVLIGSYPIIDAENGGSLEGMIAFCEATLAEIDDSTVVVPGHGNLMTRMDLVSYSTMLKTVRDRMKPLIAGGATLEQVLAAKVTAEWDAQRGNPTTFVTGSYESLTR
jgi:glyoxylase-like metal-dependent hydrolase (beta-lactamase superfamily II)